MIAKVVGFERVEFSDSKTGANISGTRLYVTYEADGIKGIGADLKYFPDDGAVKLPEIIIGRNYEFVYQQTGFSGKNRLIGVKLAN
jgi:hypothetical protein